MTGPHLPETPRPDAEAFERDMRTKFVTRENLAKLFGMVMPHLREGQRTLVYILTQSDRIGHFTLEPQILDSLYGDSYDRIVVVTAPWDRPGTNALVPSCYGDRFVWVQTDDEVILAMGFIDGGLADLKLFHLLLSSPRLTIVDFFKKMVDGVEPKLIGLPDAAREKGHAQLRDIGLDPGAPFAYFHMRTPKYRETMTHHGHRTASIETYRPSIRRILDAGYQVVRIGEKGLEPPDWFSDGYFSLPDALPELAPQDRAADLAVLADAAFGTAQNSGPIWVAAAFGTPTLRTNTPYEHLNLPYTRDLSLFKRYRDDRTGRMLPYREILDRRLPAVIRSEDYAKLDISVVENSADEIDAATEEFFGMLAGGPSRLPPDDYRRFLALGRAYEREIAADPWFQKETLDFYSHAHPFGDFSGKILESAPDFLD
ncbi:TIGR04372 family glycosyltransferase [Thalassobaculum salexigens]|uniref:TIGR04372 family glycosyltransferase n=1 Tax=Thalassobaculum salexigens TaxID=455360 RepID=UPI0003F4DA48|nr:TIGR04372 family glycosyltransferase [Thalassobaculum salexigens]